MSNTCARVRARALARRTRAARPRSRYDAGISASLPIRLVTAPTRPTLRVVAAGAIRRGSQPGGTSVSSFSSTSTSPRASARPWLQARAKPALRAFSTRRTCGLRVGQLAQVLRRAVARAVVDDDQLVVRVLGAGEHALQAHAGEEQVVVGDDHDAHRRAAGPGMHRAAPGTGRPASAPHGLAARRRVGRRETGVEVEIRRERAGAVALAPGSPARCTRSTPTSAEQAAEHDVVREVLARDLLGGAAVALVVGVDRLDRRQDLVHRREREQALAGREHVAEAGVLADHRPAGGQVGGAAVAEPAGAQAHVLVLGDGELAARVRDVVAVGVGVGGEVERVPHLPALSLEHLLVLGLVARERQLERLGGALRQVDELHELVVLAPAVALAVEHRRRATAGASCRSSSAARRASRARCQKSMITGWRVGWNGKRSWVGRPQSGLP